VTAISPTTVPTSGGRNFDLVYGVARDTIPHSYTSMQVARLAHALTKAGTAAHPDLLLNDREPASVGLKQSYTKGSDFHW
jgi:hypothetical protein